MKRQTLIAIIVALLFCAGTGILVHNAFTAGTGKWVIAIKGFCTNGMVKDAKEEMTASKCDFDRYCKKADKRKAIDARCKNNNLEVKCR